MLFDPEDKKNKPFIDYFKEKTVLIVDPQKSIRTNLKKIILDLGVVSINLSVVETLEQAEEWVKTKKPHYIFSSFMVGERKAIELMDLHKQIHPNRFAAGFYLLSNISDHSAAVAVLEHEADAFVSQPFTVDKMTKTILTRVTRKLAPNAYQREIAKAKIMIAAEKYEEATSILEAAEGLSDIPVLCHYLKGQILEKQGEKDRAVESYQNGLAYQMENYYCLSVLVDAFFEKGDFERSYAFMNTLLENYPINPNRYGRFIEIVLKNNQFIDLFKFAELVENLSEHEIDQETKDQLKDGFIIGAKGFLELGKSKDSANASKWAIELSKGSLSTLKEAIPLLIEAKDFDGAKEIIEKHQHMYADEMDFKIIELNAFALSGDHAKTLTVAMNLMRQKVKEEKVYVIAIETAIKMGRKSDFIEDLVFQASSVIPEKRDYFAQLANN